MTGIIHSDIELLTDLLEQPIVVISQREMPSLHVSEVSFETATSIPYGQSPAVSSNGNTQDAPVPDNPPLFQDGAHLDDTQRDDAQRDNDQLHDAQRDNEQPEHLPQRDDAPPDPYASLTMANDGSVHLCLSAWGMHYQALAGITADWRLPPSHETWEQTITIVAVKSGQKKIVHIAHAEHQAPHTEASLVQADHKPNDQASDSREFQSNAPPFRDAMYEASGLDEADLPADGDMSTLTEEQLLHQLLFKTLRYYQSSDTGPSSNTDSPTLTQRHTTTNGQTKPGSSPGQMITEHEAPHLDLPETPEMARLRELLLKPERQRIARLEAELASVRQQLFDSEALIEILSPIIMYAIAERVRESKDEVAEALYPAIGKSITRAVQEAIRDLARTIDTKMRQGLNSPKQLVQRLGMTLRGVDPQAAALRDLLPFEIQEIFLIHRDTGLLVHHLSNTNTLTDADLISGMLTAIRAYVRDSFGTNTDGSLDAISYGNLRIIIEEGSLVYVAVVLHGTEPAGYQTHMREHLSALHAQLGSELRSYAGDPIDEDKLMPFLHPLMEKPDASA